MIDLALLIVSTTIVCIAAIVLAWGIAVGFGYVFRFLDRFGDIVFGAIGFGILSPALGCVWVHRKLQERAVARAQWQVANERAEARAARRMGT